MTGDSQAPSHGLADRLTGMVEPVVRSEGLILVELAFTSDGSGSVLRLFVDRPEGGVTIEECTLVSRQVSDLLDVEDVIPGRYHLEVSSPGLTRRIKSPREYELFAGRLARLIVNQDSGGTEVIKGVLKGLQGDEVLIAGGGKTRAVPLSQVAKANLDIEV
jgi:ribosome maturation factor RimP